MKVDVTYSLSQLFSLCGRGHAAMILPGAGLITMFSLGLLGSMVHCGAMCGPLVLGQVANKLACVPCSRMTERNRLSAGALLPYHLGRIGTYAVLGGMAGAMGFGLASALQPLRSALLVAAAAALIYVALGRGGPGAQLSAAAPRRLAPLLARVRPGGLAFGLVLGLLPCGLVYTALLAACATSSPAWGAASMIAFGLGTAPVLVAIGVAGQARTLRAGLLRAAPAILMFNAGVLLLAALYGVLV